MTSTAGFWLRVMAFVGLELALFDALSLIYIDLAKAKSEALVNILIFYSMENTTLHMQHT